LESVLGASPREFESRILRHADQVKRHTVVNGGNRLVSILVRILAAIWALTSTNAGLIDHRDIQVG
jgi:hypothetical protein